MGINQEEQTLNSDGHSNIGGTHRRDNPPLAVDRNNNQ
jgi:hypothetical protein